MTSYKLFQTRLKTNDVTLHNFKLQRGALETKSDLSTEGKSMCFPGSSVQMTFISANVILLLISVSE